MDNLKFILISVFALGVVGLGGYWALITMQSGSDHVNIQKIKTLETENEELKQQVEKLNTLLVATPTTTPVATEPVKTPEKPATATPPVKKPTTLTTYKNQTLINELQKLANAGTVLKLKTASPAVGSVQKFLNLYNKTSKRIDNDYGASTKTAVAAFQKAQGLTASGEAGKATFTKMVAWLKKQG